MLQNYYLKNHGKFYFYNFHLFLLTLRVIITGASFAENFYGLERVTKNDQNINTKSKLHSLVSLTMVPYILTKLDGFFAERSRHNQQRSVINFSTIRFLYDLVVLGNWMLYTWGKSVTHSPILHILGMKLKHSGDNNTTAISLTKIIELSAFFIQFLEWWFTNQSSQANSILSLPIPPPPHSIAQNQHSKTKAGFCPICQLQLKNECVLRVSG